MRHPRLSSACFFAILWADGRINQDKLITRGEFSAMVEAFKEHYGV